MRQNLSRLHQRSHTPKRVRLTHLQDNTRGRALDCEIPEVLRAHPQGYGPPDDPD